MGATRARLPGGEFTAIWAGEALSVLGDQLAKVAVALIVFQTTGSAAWSGIVYGLTFLPPLLSAPLLAGLADRWPRRTVMVVCCLAQALCVAVMAVPGLPLPAVVAGALLIAAIQTPFKGAQGALVHDVLASDLVLSGRARLTLVREIGQLVGLGAGGAVVAVIGISGAFVVDAVTFVLAAAVLLVAVRHRPAARASGGAGRPGMRTLLGEVRGDGDLRRWAVLIVAIGITAVPDAVVVPFVVEAGADSWYVGPLLAADCLGLILAAVVLERLSRARQRRLIAPLAVLSAAPLVLFALTPVPLVAIGLLIVSGVGSAYLPLVIGEFTERVRPDLAGTTNGLVNATLRVSQGIAAITAGIAAAAMSAGMAVAAAGVTGVVLTVACIRRSTSVESPDRRRVKGGSS